MTYTLNVYERTCLDPVEIGDSFSITLWTDVPQNRQPKLSVTNLSCGDKNLKPFDIAKVLYGCLRAVDSIDGSQQSTGDGNSQTLVTNTYFELQGLKFTKHARDVMGAAKEAEFETTFMLKTNENEETRVQCWAQERIKVKE